MSRILLKLCAMEVVKEQVWHESIHTNIYYAARLQVMCCNHSVPTLATYVCSFKCIIIMWNKLLCLCYGLFCDCLNRRRLCIHACSWVDVGVWMGKLIFTFYNHMGDCVNWRPSFFGIVQVSEWKPVFVLLDYVDVWVEDLCAWSRIVWPSEDFSLCCWIVWVSELKTGLHVPGVCRCDWKACLHVLGLWMWMKDVFMF